MENRLAQAMVNYYIDHDTIDPEAFYVSVSEEEKRVLDGIAKYDIINKEASDEVYSDAIDELCLYYRKREIDKEIAALEQQKAFMSDPIVLVEISQKIRELKQQLRKKEENNGSKI